jgi:hypothetical protein
MTTSISAEQMRAAFPDLDLALETMNLEHELNEVLCFEGYVRRFEKSTEIVVTLSHGYELSIKPLITSHGGYSAWTRTQTTINAETRETMSRKIYATHCTIRGAAHQELKTAEFEIEASTLERVVLKALYSMQKTGKKRLVPIPNETIN